MELQRLSDALTETDTISSQWTSHQGRSWTTWQNVTWVVTSRWGRTDKWGYLTRAVLLQVVCFCCAQTSSKLKWLGSLSAELRHMSIWCCCSLSWWSTHFVICCASPIFTTNNTIYHYYCSILSFCTMLWISTALMFLIWCRCFWCNFYFTAFLLGFPPQGINKVLSYLIPKRYKHAWDSVYTSMLPWSKEGAYWLKWSTFFL